MVLLGADTKSIKNIRKNYTLSQLPLNISYRCPEKVIKLARTIVPDIDWNKTRSDARRYFIYILCRPWFIFKTK